MKSELNVNGSTGIERQIKTAKGVYEQHFVVCGKEHCHCKVVGGHGPYWYFQPYAHPYRYPKYIGLKVDLTDEEVLEDWKNEQIAMKL